MSVRTNCNGMSAADLFMMIGADEPELIGLVKQVGSDVKTIARSELELARSKLGSYFEHSLIRASIMLLAVLVALVGLAMLCMVAVFALEPVIARLWLRILMMSVAYLGLGTLMSIGTIRLLFPGATTTKKNR
ncbi:MAG: phage holin family protein [Kofleriaceae bacterium]